MSRLWILCIVVVLVCGATAYGVTPSFQGLGDLPGGYFSSKAYGVSADGSAVVGISKSDNGWEAFRWTSSDDQMIPLGDLPGGTFYSGAYGVSEDGAVVIGGSDSGSGWSDQGFRWTEQTSMVGLGNLPGGGDTWSGRAADVSADGSVVVGWDDGLHPWMAYRWTSETGMVPLGYMPDHEGSTLARAVSSDGTIIVGYGTNISSYDEAFRWMGATGIVALGGFDGYDRYSQAHGISADGTVIVGHARSGHDQAFRWTAETGMVPLGELSEEHPYSKACDVSADGSVVVGNWGAPWSDEPFIWDADNGMRALSDVLTDDYGLDLTGWILESIEGISDDGCVLVGYGITPDWQSEAWMAIIPEPATLSLLAVGAVALIRRRRK